MTEPLTDAALALEVARIAGFVETCVRTEAGPEADPEVRIFYYGHYVEPLLEAAKRLSTPSNTHTSAA